MPVSDDELDSLLGITDDELDSLLAEPSGVDHRAKLAALGGTPGTPVDVEAIRRKMSGPGMMESMLSAPGDLLSAMRGNKDYKGKGPTQGSVGLNALEGLLESPGKATRNVGGFLEYLGKKASDLRGGNREPGFLERLGGGIQGAGEAWSDLQPAFDSAYRGVGSVEGKQSAGAGAQALPVMLAAEMAGPAAAAQMLGVGGAAAVQSLGEQQADTGDASLRQALAVAGPQALAGPLGAAMAEMNPVARIGANALLGGGTDVVTQLASTGELNPAQSLSSALQNVAIGEVGASGAKRASAEEALAKMYAGAPSAEEAMAAADASAERLQAGAAKAENRIDDKLFDVRQAQKMRDEALGHIEEQIHGEIHDQVMADSMALRDHPALNDPQIRGAMAADIQRRAVDRAIARGANLPPQQQETLITKASASAKKLFDSINPEQPQPEPMQGPTPPPVSNQEAGILADRLIAGTRVSKMFPDGMDVSEARGYLRDYASGNLAWDQIPQDLQQSIERAAQRMDVAGAVRALPEPQEPQTGAPWFAPMGDVQPLPLPEVWGKPPSLATREGQSVPGVGDVEAGGNFQPDGRVLPPPPGFEAPQGQAPASPVPAPSFDAALEQARLQREAAAKMPGGKVTSGLRLKQNTGLDLGGFEVGGMDDQASIMTGGKPKVAPSSEKPVAPVGRGKPQGLAANVFDKVSAWATDQVRNQGGEYGKRLARLGDEINWAAKDFLGKFQPDRDNITLMLSKGKHSGRLRRNLMETRPVDLPGGGKAEFSRLVDLVESGEAPSDPAEALFVNAWKRMMLNVSKAAEGVGVRQNSGEDFVANPNGSVVMRFARPELRAVMMGDPAHSPFTKAFVEAIKVANPGIPTEKILLDFANIKKTLGGNTPESAANFELKRAFKNVPVAIEVGGRRVELYENDPVQIAKKTMDRSAMRLGYISRAGQNSDAINNAVEDFMSKGGGSPLDASALVTALNGLPLEASAHKWLDPNSPNYGKVKAIYDLGEGLRLLKAGALTGSGIQSISEPLGTTALMGKGRMLRAYNDLASAWLKKTLLRRPQDYDTLVNDMAARGSITFDVADMFFDPQHPVRSAVRSVSEGLLNLPLVGNKPINEFVEQWTALTARKMTQDLMAGKAKPLDGELIRYAMPGLTDAEVAAMVAGKASPEMYQHFEQQVVARMQGTTNLPSETARVQRHPLLREFFAFSRYGSKEMGNAKLLAQRLSEANASGDKRALAKAGGMAAKYAGASAAQAITQTATLALFGGGAYGLLTKMDEAKDRPIWEAAKALAMTKVAGPGVQWVTTAIQGFDKDASLREKALGGAFYVNVAEDTLNAAKGDERYRNMSTIDRAIEWGRQRAPIVRPAERAALSVGAMFGVVADFAPEMRSAKRVYYSWRESNAPKKYMVGGEMDDHTEDLLRAAKSVVIEAQRGDLAGAKAAAQSALGEGLTPEELAKRIRAAKFFRGGGNEAAVAEAFQKKYPRQAETLSKYDVFLDTIADSVQGGP